MTVDQLHIYVDPDLKYRWGFVAANGPKMGDSGQGYADIRDCRRGFSILNRRTLDPVPLYQLESCDRHDGRPCMVWQIPRTLPEEPTVELAKALLARADSLAVLKALGVDDAAVDKAILHSIEGRALLSMTDEQRAMAKAARARQSGATR